MDTLVCYFFVVFFVSAFRFLFRCLFPIGFFIIHLPCNKSQPNPCEYTIYASYVGFLLKKQTLNYKSLVDLDLQNCDSESGGKLIAIYYNEMQQPPMQANYKTSYKLN